MPVYNGSKYLKEAIESILNQSYNHLEFIIINDGSTDNSEKIILSYNDSRIVYIKNETNLGLIKSLNNGISISKGKYLARMDADDISLTDRLKHQLEFMEQNLEIGVCSCNYVQFRNTSKKKHKAFSLHDEILGFMLFNSSIIHPSLLIRKSLLDMYSPVFDSNYKHAEDYELWARLIFKCKFSAVNSTDFHYRLHEHQVTQKHNAEQKINANKVRKNILERAGFTISESELIIHSLIGSSERITQFSDLQLAEKWLTNLLNQNKEIKTINVSIFNNIISKQWYDTCGNTTLGLKAYRFYKTSELKNLSKKGNLKLFLKCVIRKIRK